MEALALFMSCFVGTLFVPGQPEATAALYAAHFGWNAFAVGLVAGAGQCATYVVLFLGGDQLIRRWGFLRRQMDRVRLRYEAQLQRNSLLLAALSGSVGLPPAVGLAAVAGGMKVHFASFMTVMYISRVLRLSVLAVFGEQLGHWWRAL